jgi:hypothetical protein
VGDLVRQFIEPLEDRLFVKERAVEILQHAPRL